MDEKTLILKTREKEAPAMRKVLERIPEGSDYRPDPKSRTAREIAWLIVQEDIQLVEGIEKGKLEWIEVPVPSTMKEVLETYDRHVRTAHERLTRLDATRWTEDVPFLFQGQEVMKSSRSRRRGASCSTRSITAVSSRPTFGRWARRCRRYTARVPTSRCRAARGSL